MKTVEPGKVYIGAKPTKFVLPRPKPLVEYFPFIKQGKTLITAKQARQIADLCVHPKQRQIRNPNGMGAVPHVRSLVYQMRKGGDAWLEGFQVDIAELEGCYYVLNGNTRMLAQARAEVDLAWNFEIRKVRDTVEMLNMFRRFDNNLFVRSAAQDNKVVDFDITLGVDTGLANAAYACMSLILSGFAKAKINSKTPEVRDRDFRREIAIDVYGDQIRDMGEMLSNAYESNYKRKFYRPAILSVALVTMKECTAKALPYWNAVIRNSELVAHTPAHTFAHTINNNNSRENGPLSQVLDLAISTHCWNSNFLGKNLKPKKGSNAWPQDLPYAAIEGTQFADGGAHPYPSRADYMSFAEWDEIVDYSYLVTPKVA